MMPLARSLARALTLRCRIALFFRGAHAPTVVQIAICESERMSSASPGCINSSARFSAWYTPESSPVLLVGRTALYVLKPTRNCDDSPGFLRYHSVARVLLQRVASLEFRDWGEW